MPCWITLQLRNEPCASPPQMGRFVFSNHGDVCASEGSAAACSYEALRSFPDASSRRCDALRHSFPSRLSDKAEFLYPLIPDTSVLL